MFKKFNIILILGLALLYSPSHSKEIYKDKKDLSSSTAEIAKDMVDLNANLDLLSIRISNLLTRQSI